MYRTSMKTPSQVEKEINDQEKNGFRLHSITVIEANTRSNSTFGIGEGSVKATMLLLVFEKTQQKPSI